MRNDIHWEPDTSDVHKGIPVVVFRNGQFNAYNTHVCFYIEECFTFVEVFNIFCPNVSIIHNIIEKTLYIEHYENTLYILLRVTALQVLTSSSHGGRSSLSYQE